MAVLVHVRTVDDVKDDEDVIKLLRDLKKLALQFARELGTTTNQLSAALRVYDERAHNRRRGKVCRPLYMGAGALLLVARYLILASKRFQREYEREIEANRRGRRRRRRPFGG